MRTMSRRVLVLGGVRSGKSRYAERLLADRSHVQYVATAADDGTDPEWSARIADHRRRRPPSWMTIETTAVAEILADLQPDQAALVDCLTVWLARVLDETPSRAAERIDELAAAWEACRGIVVAVSNEVGCGVVPPYPSGRIFRDLLGELNARLAADSDDVIFMVAGIGRSLLTGRRVT